MREKFGMAGFVLLLAVVWGTGFLWFRGELPGAGDTRSAGASTSGDAGDGAQARPGPGTPASPSSPEVSPNTESLPPASASLDRGNRDGTGRQGAKAPVVTKVVESRPQARRPVPEPLPPVAEFTVATFNVLGSTHTGAGGHHSWLASGPARMSGTMALIRQHGVSVIGMQEFQPNQRNAFRARAGGWSMYPGNSHGNAGANSVAWDTAVWELVKPGLINIPYFHGNQRPMPYVLLRHKETGVKAYFSTFHNPANVMGPAARYRAEATRRQIGLFRRLEASGIPQFVTGDMNERHVYFCKVTEATPLEAPQGGSNNGPCRPPSPTPIDWIFNSPRVEVVDFKLDRSSLVRRTSDHPFIAATVRVDALDYGRAYSPEG